MGAAPGFATAGATAGCGAAAAGFTVLSGVSAARGVTGAGVGATSGGFGGSTVRPETPAARSDEAVVCNPTGTTASGPVTRFTVNAATNSAAAAAVAFLNP